MDDEDVDNLSEDSDDDLVNYFDCNDSDSDLSDSQDGPSQSTSSTSLSAADIPPSTTTGPSAIQPTPTGDCDDG